MRSYVRSRCRIAALAVVVAAGLLVRPLSRRAPACRAGAGVVDGTYHVGSSAGQYSTHARRRLRRGRPARPAGQEPGVLRRAVARERRRSSSRGRTASYVAIVTDYALHPAGRAVAAHRAAGSSEADRRRDQPEEPDHAGHATTTPRRRTRRSTGACGRSRTSSTSASSTTTRSRTPRPIMKALNDMHDVARQRHGQLLRQVPQQPDGPRLGPTTARPPASPGPTPTTTCRSSASRTSTPGRPSRSRRSSTSASTPSSSRATT